MTSWISSFQDFIDQNPALHLPEYKKDQAPFITFSKEAVSDEALWDRIRRDFFLTNEFINLNNAAVASNPAIVAHAFTHYYKLVNTAPSYYTWKVMEHGKEVIRQGLSELINCSKDEVAILRNTTEASNNVIFGINLQAGDEVVLSKQDYTKVVSSWKQRELREGIKLVWVDIDPATDTNETIIEKYIAALSLKTKVLQLTHVINWNGQIIPVAPIIKEAKNRGVDVILDGAHSFGLIETDVAKLGCDYFFTALHKWLSGPIPSSLLFIKKEKIAATWPLASSIQPQSDDIRKFEELSIQLYPNVLALGYAIEYHTKLGRKLKEERQRHLRRMWTASIADADGIKCNTPLEEDQCCAIVNLTIKNYKPAEIEKFLWDEYKIHVGTVHTANMQGIRVSPNIYTKPESLKLLSNALLEIANKKGV